MNHRLLIFILFTTATFLSYFFQLGNAVISPDLSAELNLTPAELGLMSSAFFATFALAQIPLGIGLDRLGARWVVSGLLVVGVIGSVIFATAQSFLQLTIGRGLIGFGMASILMGSLKILSQVYPPNRFATMSGLLVAFGSLGAFFAATPLAWFNAQVGWRTVFIVMGGVALCVALLIALFGHPPNPTAESSDQDAQQNSLFAILQDTRFWRLALVGMWVAGTVFAFQGLWAGPYLFDVYGLSQIEVGNFLLLLAIGSTVGSVSSGWLGDRFDLVRVLWFGIILFILSQLALAFRPPLIVVGISLFLFGFSAASTILVFAQLRQIFPPEITGQALSTANLFMFAGIFLLQWFLGVIIERFEANELGVYPPTAYSTAFFLTAFLCLLAIFIYYPLVKQSNDGFAT